MAAELTATMVQAIARRRLFRLERAKENPCILNTLWYPSRVGCSGIQRMGIVRIASEPLNEEDSIHKKGRTVNKTMTSSIR